MGNQINIKVKEHNQYSLPAGFNIEEFLSYLDDVWINRLLFAEEDFGEEPVEKEPSRKQPFFTFTHDNQIKAHNYIGFIRWRTFNFDIIPKVFEQVDESNGRVWEHTFYWLSYCRRIIFPFAKLESFPKEIDNLAEALIYMFAKHANYILSENPYSQYEEVVSTGQVLKGRLNFNSYIEEQYTKGNPHQLVMEHEPFTHDNLLNQIIKFVSSGLQNICRYTDTFHELQGVIFQLEEVDDIQITAKDCDRVKFNRLFGDYSLILDMCRFFLSESYLNRESGSLQNLSFLLPMEYIFEDYIAGFLEQHFSSSYTTNYQARSWLTDQHVFQLKHDIVLTKRETKEKLIIDTKYKLRQSKTDRKKGISQVDLYQMVSYAVRANCNKILLLYPSHKSSTWDIDHFSISSKMFNAEPIDIFAAEVPIVFDDLHRADQEVRIRLNQIFEEIDSYNSKGNQKK